MFMKKNLLLYLFTMMALLLGLFSCSGNDENSSTEEGVKTITLSLNKEIIDLDERETLTFKVMTNLDEDVTSKSTLYANDEIISTKGNFSPKKVGFYEIKAKYGDFTSNIINVEVKGTVLEKIFISSNVTTLDLNEEEAFTFSVKTDLDVEATSLSAFYINGEKIEGNTFKPVKEGEYEAYAIYKNRTSEKITLFVKKTIIENSITIVSNLENISVDSEEGLIFNVKTDLDFDVTSSSIVYVNGQAIEGNTYSPTEEGEYSIYATYGDYTSETITVTAERKIIENTIVISAENSSIDINSEKGFVFTVKTDLGVNITSESVILVNGIEITGNTYKPTVEGDYAVYARYKNYTSEVITVKAKKDIVDSKILVSASPSNVDINSEEVFTFSVKTDLDVDITSLSTIYVNGSEITENTYKPSVEGDYEVYAKYEEYTSEVITVTAEKKIVENSIAISASPTNVDINSEEAFTFSVKTDLDVDITSLSTIYVNGSEITGNTYKPTVKGSYEVYAKYEGYRSESITVIAEEKIIENSITISASPSNVDINSEEVFTFSVKTDLDVDITSLSTIYVNGSEIGENTYKPTVEGNYEVYAKYEDYTSSTITVAAQDSSIKNIMLSAVNTSVKIGTDHEFEFTIQSDKNEDITSLSTIYINGSEITGNTYKPTEEGSYEVYAKYENFTSNTITVSAQLATFIKNALIEDFTGTWCGWCPRISYAIEQVKSRSNKVISVAIHRYQSSNPSSRGYDPFTYNTRDYPNAPSSYPTGRLDRGRTWSSPQPSYLNQVLELTGDRNNLGLAILDTSLSGNQISFKVKVGIGKAKDPYNNNFKDYRKFGLVVYLMEDDLIYDQVNYTGYYGGGSVISNFEHDDVLRSSLTHMQGDDISANQRTEGSVYTRSFNVQVPSNIKDRSKLKVVAFIVGSSTGYANSVLNAQSVKIGENRDFQISN
ncbi:hypothetical protein UJ101_01841 [Flavobacteriaceae bacterium UJ101]|nr:hypothetical protein UJ101_01841 [Flavobacteriaceae bacterium UJ101]